MKQSVLNALLVLAVVAGSVVTGYGLAMAALDAQAWLKHEIRQGCYEAMVVHTAQMVALPGQ